MLGNHKRLYSAGLKALKRAKKTDAVGKSRSGVVAVLTSKLVAMAAR